MRRKKFLPTFGQSKAKLSACSEDESRGALITTTGLAVGLINDSPIFRTRRGAGRGPSSIKQDGGAILTNTAEEKALTRFTTELEPYLVETPFGRDAFTG